MVAQARGIKSTIYKNTQAGCENEKELFNITFAYLKQIDQMPWLLFLPWEKVSGHVRWAGCSNYDSFVKHKQRL